MSGVRKSLVTSNWRSCHLGGTTLFKKLILAAAAAAATTALFALPVHAQQAEDPAFTAKLRASLSAHPELISEAMQAGQQKERAAQTEAYNTKAAPLRAEMFAKGFGPVLGNPNGTVPVVEFVDYACPICKTAHTSIDNIVKKRPEVRVIIAMRLIFGPESEKLARFALASDLQGKFPATHDALYEKFGDHHETKPTDEVLKAIAGQVGLNYDQLVKDMNGPKVNATFENQTKVADQIGVSGTPFFLTRDAVYPGAAPENVMSEAFR